MTQSLSKRDTKSKSHPGMKLAPVRVFSCKHHLTMLSWQEEHHRKSSHVHLKSCLLFSFGISVKGNLLITGM